MHTAFFVCHNFENPCFFANFAVDFKTDNYFILNHQL